MNIVKLVVVIKGAGEVASAVAHRLTRAGFRVCLTEIAEPLAVHRGSTFSEAVFETEKTVEGITARLCKSYHGIESIWEEDKIPLIIDPQAKVINYLKPRVVVDAIMAKRNLGTQISDAELVIGIGPGFYAGQDVHLVIESYHNENLGRVIETGTALANNAIPVSIGGYTFERAVHASADGRFVSYKKIGDTILKGDILACLDDEPLKAEIDGRVRAILNSGLQVKRGTKLIELDPEADEKTFYLIRAKMRAIAGGVLEAILLTFNK